MIGVVSDKFAGLGALPTCGRQCPLIIKKKKQSIPRARKQKCQTQPPGCRNSWPLSRYEAPLGRFFGKFSAILDQNCPPTCSSHLTFLTGLCQKCQTNSPERSHDGDKPCVLAERASHHNTPAPLHVGTVTRQSNHIPAAGARSPSAPVRASYQHISKPLHSSFPISRREQPHPRSAPTGRSWLI